MRHFAPCLVGIATIVLVTCPPASGADDTVTLESLLNETVDRDGLAKWPINTYTGKEATSYDRKSVAPDKPGWFANEDSGNYIRTETNQNRQEYVMMDTDGPGAIVCLFKASSDPKGILRIYLDNDPSPVIEENFRYFAGGGLETDQEKHYNEKRVPPYPPDATKFLGGYGPLKPPFAGVYSLGCDCYFPIPYAKHCKVTYDLPGRCYYRINYRTYSSSTAVETFTLAALKNAAPLMDQIGQALLNPTTPADANLKTLSPQTQSLEGGASLSATLDGPAAIRQLTVHLQANDEAQALRSTVLAITFDGEPTVWAPVGDFFSAGIGIHPFHDWNRTVTADGLLSCRWTMPFGKSCKIELINLGSQTVEATLGATTYEDWAWDGHSMYFHANWHQQYPIQTVAKDGTMDWNYIETTGQGVYVGDNLVVHNGNTAWWGEGDEKIYVDGENFPSQFGTGTEDYYGYSRGGSASLPFESPFITHRQYEGDFKPAYTSMTRIRALDAIPFTNHLKFDIEVWDWSVTTLEYAATTFWYALPGATCNRPPDKTEAARPVILSN